VPRSPDDSSETLATDDDYLAAWSAANRLLESGKSWSGHERNCAFLSCPIPRSDPRFANVSASSGLDFLDDGRGLAVVDWDHDGDLDLWLSNRTAPRLRFMRNDIRSPSPFVALRLTGTTCNRDAIGARVELKLSEPTQGRLVQTLSAGDAFLSQSSKWIHFGLGAGRIRQVMVRWPGGKTESFTGLTAGRRFELVQGKGRAVEWRPPKRALALTPSNQEPVESVPSSYALIPMRFPLPVLPFSEYERATHQVIQTNAQPLLVNFWASWCTPCVAELKELIERKRDLQAAGLDVLSLSVDGMGADDTTDPATAHAQAQDLLDRLGYPFQHGMATRELLEKLQLVESLLFDRTTFAVPVSLLLDRNGRLAAIYRGRVSVERLLHDVENLTATPNERRNQAVPFQGTWVDVPGEIDLSQAAGQFFDRYPLDTLMYMELALKQQERMGDSVSDENRKQVDRLRTDVHRRMALEFKQSGRLDDAIEQCRKSLSIEPRQATLQLLLGNLLSDTGKPEEAIAAYEVAQRIDPALTEAQFGLGLAHGQLGHFEQAAAWFEKVISARENDARAHFNLGTAWEQLSRLAEAIESYRQAVTLDPDLADAHNKLSMALARGGQYDEAITHLTEFLRLRPGAFDWHYALGRLLIQADRGAEALEPFAQAERLKPDWVPPLNAQAWILATHPDPSIRDEEKALQLAERVAALTEHRNAEILDTLAAAYAAVGQYDRAVNAAQQAIKLAADIPELADQVRARLKSYQQEKPYREGEAKHQE